MSFTSSLADLGLLVLQLVLLALQAGVGALLARHFAAESSLVERWVVGGVAAISISSALALLVGLLGAFSAGAVVIATGAVFLLLRAASPPRRPPASSRSAGRRQPVGERLALALALLCAAPFALRSLLEVPLDWDGLTYHLYLPVRWLQAGRIELLHLPPPLHIAGHMPMSADLFRFLSAIVVRSDLLVKVVSLPVLGLAGAALFALGRGVGLPREAAASVALVWVSVPAVIGWTATSYVETILDLAVLSAAALLVRLVDRETPWRTALALGLACGLALGTKLVGLHYSALVVALAMLVTWLRSRSWRRALAAAGTVAGVAFAIGGAWYVRNAIAFGNPFYPKPFLGLAGLNDPGLPAGWGSSLLDPSGWRSMASFLPLAWFSSPQFGNSGMSLGWTPAIAAPFVAAALVSAARSGWRAHCDSDRLELARVTVVPVLFLGALLSYLSLPTFGRVPWLLTNVRFATPALAFGLVLAAGFLAPRTSSPRIWGWIATGGIALNALFLDWRLPSAGWLVPAWISWFALLALVWTRARGLRRRHLVLLGSLGLVLLLASWSWRESHRFDQLELLSEVHRSQHTVFAAAARRVSKEPPDRALAIAGSGPIEFYYLYVGPRLNRTVVAGEPLDACRPAGPALRGETEKWLECLRRQGIDLLLVTRWRAPHGAWPPEVLLGSIRGLSVLYDDPLIRVYDLGQSRDEGADEAHE